LNNIFYTIPMLPKNIERAVYISATPPIVWQYLTDTDMMARWMGEQEMNIKVETDWTVGNPIVISGFHHTKFENKGRVLDFEPNKLLQYTHLSSVSRLPGDEENYAIISFLLSSENEGTLLTLTLERFATETIMKHLDFYWRGAINVLKRRIETS